MKICIRLELAVDTPHENILQRKTVFLMLIPPYLLIHLLQSPLKLRDLQGLQQIIDDPQLYSLSRILKLRIC